MAITKSFARKEDAIRDGVWFEVGIDESNGLPIKVKLARGHNSNPQFKREIENATRTKRAALSRRSAQTNDMLTKAVQEAVVVACFKDWENVILNDEDGPLPFSTENVRQIVELLPEFLDACVTFATDDNNYVGCDDDADAEGDVKN